MNEKSQYLVKFTEPIARMIIGSPNERAQFSKRGTLFIEQYKDLSLKDFMIKADVEFGQEVNICDRYFRSKNIEHLHSIMKYFFILSIFSLVVGLLVVLANIK